MTNLRSLTNQQLISKHQTITLFIRETVSSVHGTLTAGDIQARDQIEIELERRGFDAEAMRA